MNTFSIKGADGGTIQVPPGEYYFNPKARARRMMQNSLSAEARRIYACLELATMGFRQELAVTMDKGVKVPLSNAHIQDQTGLSKQNVRRGLAELEAAGLVERRGINGGPLHKGKIEIYSWSTPRLVEEKNGSRARLPFPCWFSQSLEPLRTLITRYKYKLPQDLEAARDYLPAMEEAARDYERAEKVVTELLERVCARPPKGRALIRSERTERNIERTDTPSSSSSCTVEEIPAPIPPPSSTTTKLISETIEKHNIPADASAVETLIAKCRTNKPDATEAEICRAVELKGPISKEKKNPIGFLLTAVANCFAGGASPPLVMASAAGAETADQRKNREFWESMERRQPKPCPTT